MSDFENLGLKAGVWSGLLHRPAAPDRVGLVHRGAVVAEARVAPVKDGMWRIEVDLPGGQISDGVTSFLLSEVNSGDDQAALPGNRLASLSVMAGQALEQDMLVELELIRAELDLLKREFRRFGAQG